MKKHRQGRQVFLCKAVLFVPPFVKIHAAVICTRNATQESHAVLCSTIAGSHDLVTAARRGSTVDSGDRASCIFAPMISNVQSNHRCTAARWSTLDDDDLGDLAILPEVLIRAEGRYELP